MSALLSRRLFLLASLGAGCKAKQEPLPDLGKVPAFALTDQRGQAFTRETLAGKVWVAAFMFTRCPTVCPRITRRMAELQQRAKERALPIHLVSFSVDPEHDTPPVLTEYAKRYGADVATWSFVTGNYSVISETAVRGFKMALEGRADASAPDFGILHGSHLVLVDGAGTMRGFYRTDDAAEIERLLGDLNRLP